MAVLTLRQDVANTASEAENIKNTFSSWNSCMSKAYCKFVALYLFHEKNLVLIPPLIDGQ